MTTKHAPLKAGKTTICIETAYAIKVRRNYVYGYNSSMQIVVMGSLALAKRFATKEKAQAWLDRHADCGYGLSSSAAKITLINKY